MDAISEEIADHIFSLYKNSPPQKRILIGIAGIPGSGKTTLARNVAKCINQKLQSLATENMGEELAIMVPMDGYHYYRHELDKMPDPAFAHARRGSPFTFNSYRLLALVKSLAAPISSTPLKAPSFDHALKDPIEDDIIILPSHRIIVMEGNYLSFSPPSDDTPTANPSGTEGPKATYSSTEPWREIAETFNERYFVQCDKDVAEKRLIKRHVLAGIVKDAEEGKERVWMNDMPNGVDIENHRLGDERVVVSVEDESLNIL